MKMIQELENKIEEQSKNIEHIKKHNHEVANSLIKLTENVRIINDNLDDIYEKSMVFSQKISSIETTIKHEQDRIKESKNYIATALTTWPKAILQIGALIIGLVWIIDYDKVNALIKYSIS